MHRNPALEPGGRSFWEKGTPANLSLTTVRESGCRRVAGALPDGLRRQDREGKAWATISLPIFVVRTLFSASVPHLCSAQTRARRSTRFPLVNYQMICSTHLVVSYRRLSAPRRQCPMQPSVPPLSDQPSFRHSHPQPKCGPDTRHRHTSRRSQPCSGEAARRASE